MVPAVSNNHEFQILNDLDPEEQLLLNDCVFNMIGHLERNIEKPAFDHKKISKLLTYRYLFQKNLKVMQK